MEKKEVISMEELNPCFKYEIASQPGGEHIMKCVQCATCTLGCPVAFVSEKFNPQRIIRMTVLGLKDTVLQEDFVWYCPQTVRMPDLMSAIRNIAVKEGLHPAYKEQGQLSGEHRQLYEITDFENEKREKALCNSCSTCVALCSEKFSMHNFTDNHVLAEVEAFCEVI